MSCLLSHDALLDGKVLASLKYNFPIHSIRLKNPTLLRLSAIHCINDNTSSPVVFNSIRRFSVLAKNSQKPVLVHSDDSSVSITEKYYHLREDYQMPKYPIVLSHGLSGFDRLIYIPRFKSWSGKDHHKVSEKDLVSSTEMGDKHQVGHEDGIELFQYWHGIKKALVSRGCTVIVGKVPAFGRIEDRASTLNQLISKEVDILTENKTKTEIYNDEKSHDNNQKLKVNLIAHSMGGWDCRYLISELEHRNYEVVSLTTVGTPHRGSAFADYVTERVPSKLLNTIAPSISQLTTGSCIERSNVLKNVPGVLYFSYGACYEPSPMNVFYFSWRVINKREGPNDGMISVESSKWGKYLGTLENVDHLDLINWVSTVKIIKSKITGSSHTFNPIALYLDIADQLARQGL